MIAELAHNHFRDQTGTGDAAWYRPWWQGSRLDAVLATTASVFGPHVKVSFQLRPLEFQLPRDVLTDAVHRAATARTLPFFFRQVVGVHDLWQIVPIDLAFLAATAMAFDFDFIARAGSIVGLVRHRQVQLEQMSLPFAFRETLSPSAKRPPFVPGQFVQRGGMLFLKLVERGSRFVQDTAQFRHLLLRGSGTLFGFCSLLLKLYGLLVGSYQELVAFR